MKKFLRSDIIGIIQFSLPVVIVFVLFVFTIFSILLPSIKNSIIGQKKQMIKQLVLSQISSIEIYYESYQNGALSKNEAQYLAKEHLRNIRYGENNQEYFWINNLDPVVVMHPYRTDMEGDSLETFTDFDGNPLLYEFKKIVEASNAGFVSYMWQWHADSNVIMPKLSYIRGFEPWGWVIGTGVYMDDVEKKIASITRKATIISLFILGAVFIVMTYIIISGYRATKMQIIAANELESSESRFREIFMKSHDAICVIENQKIVVSNPTFIKIFGYHEKEICARDFDISKLFNPDSKVFFTQITNLHAKRKELPSLIHLVGITKKNNAIDLDLSLSSIYWDAKRALLVIARDVSEQRKLEAQLSQSQKMESIGRLAGGIAHDFNNLLTAIIGYSQLVKSSLTPNNPVINEIDEVIKTSQRAANLTRRLLTFSKRQPAAPQIININSIIKEIKKMLNRLITENISIEISLDNKLWNIKMDPGQIEQILVNLVVNSKEALPDGGKILIETKNIVFDNDYISVDKKIRTAGRWVLVAVSDNGIGMSKEILSHVFEPFFTTKTESEGTGLGLPTVYGIVKQNDGDIWVYSENGKGTTFKIYFPAVTGVETLLPSQKTENKKLQGNETILIVEDDVTVRNLAKRALELYGYKILEASSGKDGLEIYSQNKDAIDIVLSDVIMPEMSGKELGKALITINPAIKIIFMSGYTGEVIEKHQDFLEKHTIIEKPFTPQYLASKIRAALDN